MTNIKISIMRVVGSDAKIPLPAYETIGAVGMDLRANFKDDLRISGITLGSGQRALIPTGLALALPHGYEAQIRPRSGLALKKGVSIVNSPGTVDWDYRGEVGVVIINHGAGPFDIIHGDRIAQMVFAPVTRAMFSVVDVLDETKRGSGSYGSTGKG
ncbi:MAG: dUTP diphosphatase [Proteobacteria bacterium]|nr:dUTP diphosphatase [Pseudomonadota bacterium]